MAALTWVNRAVCASGPRQAASHSARPDTAVVRVAPGGADQQVTRRLALVPDGQCASATGAAIVDRDEQMLAGSKPFNNRKLFARAWNQTVVGAFGISREVLLGGSVQSSPIRQQADRRHGPAFRRGYDRSRQMNRIVLFEERFESRAGRLEEEAHDGASQRRRPAGEAQV